MAYSLLKSILIAVKCINILKNSTESSIFTFFLLSQTQLPKRCLPSPTLTVPKIVKNMNSGSAPDTNHISTSTNPPSAFGDI